MTEGEAEHLRDAYLRAKEAMSSMNMLSYLGVRYKTGSGYCTYIFHDKSSYMQTTPAGGQSTDY